MAVDADALIDLRAVGADGEGLSLNPPKIGEVSFFIRVWVNDKAAFDSRLPEKQRAKPVRLRKGVNTVSVEWQSNVDGESVAQGVKVRFNDAKSGKPVPNLIFDMDKK